MGKQKRNYEKVIDSKRQNKQNKFPPQTNKNTKILSKIDHGEKVKHAQALTMCLTPALTSSSALQTADPARNGQTQSCERTSYVFMVNSKEDESPQILQDPFFFGCQLLEYVFRAVRPSVTTT